LTNEELIVLVRELVASKDGRYELLRAARRDEKLARAVCNVAGFLARKDETLKALLKERMKPLRRRSRDGLRAALVVYGAALKENDAQTARGILRKFEEWRTGKRISDKTIQNMLSEAANTIPLDNLPDNLRDLIEKRLEHGVKTRHRGN
jgi:hypothetical protein